MAIDASALTDYTWTQLATAAKHAMMHLAAGGKAYTINDRNFQRITMEEAQRLWELAQKNIAADTAGGGLGLVGFGERT